MELMNKINCKKFIADYPLTAKCLLKQDEKELNDAINNMACLTGLTPIFIIQNLKLIKQWI